MKGIGNRNNALDIFKLVASFFIVAIHTSFDSTNLSDMIRLSGRWAVPFFFLVSGFFFQRGLERVPAETFKKNFKKILLVFFVASLVYVPINHLSGNKLFTFRYIWNGDYFHLWYLPSMLVGFTALYFFSRIRINPYVLIVFVSVLLVLELLAGSYSFVFKTNPDYFTTRCRPLLSVPFMVIGALFEKNFFSEDILKPRIGFSLLIVGVFSQFIEAELLLKFANKAIQEHQFLVSTIIFSVGVFIVAISVRFKNEMLGRWGQRYSLFLYLYHPIIIFILLRLGLNFVEGHVREIIFPIAVFVITLFIAILVDSFFPRLFLLFSGSIKEAFTFNKA